MKRFIIFCLLTGVYYLGNAQILTVIDTENGQPLELATVISEKPGIYATTNAKGQANIFAFKGAERIEIRIIGYKTEIKSYMELEEADFLMELKISGVNIDHVVISAIRWNQPAREIPSRINSISPREIELQNPQTAADLINISGEVFIQKSQLGGGSPMIRGFATNRILISVDGVRMNTAIFRSGNIQNIISLDPFVTENAEVFFGPGSVMYGSDAIGGVLSLQTLTPQFSLTEKSYISGKTIARYSSANNERTIHLSANKGWEKWAVLSSFSFFNYDDLRMGNNGPDEYLRPFYVRRQDAVDEVVINKDQLIQVPTGYSQFNFMEKVRFKPNDKYEFSYGLHYSTTSNYSRYDRLIRVRNGLPRSAEWEYGPQLWLMNNVNVVRNSNKGIYNQLIVRLAHQYFEESRIDRDFNDDIRHERIEKVNAFSINTDFNVILNAKNHLYYGLEAVYDDINSTGTDGNILTEIIDPGPSRYPESNWSSYAVYFMYQYKVSDKFLLQAGSRYNYFLMNAEFDTTFYPFPFTKEKINRGALTGSLGFVFNPSEKWSFSSNFSTAFRSPNVDDIGKVFDSEPGSVVIPNPGLKAEYAYNAEIGMIKVFGDIIKVGISGYYTILNNAMVRRDFTLNGQDSILYDGEMSKVQAIQNAAMAKVYGIESNIEVKLISGFGFTSHINYQKGEEELDDGSTSPLRHAAPWFGTTHFTYSKQKMKLDLYMVYNGEINYENMPEEEKDKDYMYVMDSNGNPYSPGWYTLNFKVSCKISDRISFNGGIENITNQRYRPYSSGITAAGRNFIASLKGSF